MAVGALEHRYESTRERTDGAARAAGSTMGITPILTLVVWAGCLAVGTIGLKLPYPRAREPATEAEPIKAELIDVKITNDRTIRPEAGAPSPPEGSKPAKPTAAEMPQVPAPPPLPAVA